MCVDDQDLETSDTCVDVGTDDPEQLAANATAALISGRRMYRDETVQVVGGSDPIDIVVPPRLGRHPLGTDPRGL